LSSICVVCCSGMKFRRVNNNALSGSIPSVLYQALNRTGSTATGNFLVGTCRPISAAPSPALSNNCLSNGPTCPNLTNQKSASTCFAFCYPSWGPPWSAPASRSALALPLCSRPTPTLARVHMCLQPRVLCSACCAEHLRVQSAACVPCPVISFRALAPSAMPRDLF